MINSGQYSVRSQEIVDEATRSRCTLADNPDGSGLVAHDFMSYGANPWYSTGLVPLLPDGSQFDARWPAAAGAPVGASPTRSPAPPPPDTASDSDVPTEEPRHSEDRGHPHPPVRVDHRPGWLITGFVDKHGQVSFGPLTANDQAPFPAAPEHPGELVLRVRTASGDTLTVIPS